MSQLTQLSRTVSEQLPSSRPNLDDLRGRNRRRHRRRRVSVAALAVVVASSFAFARLSTSSSPPSPPTATTQLAAYFRAAGAVSNATLAAVGLPSGVAVPTTVAASRAPSASRAVVSYVGAEYCPYCALQRWVLLVALSKFGTFTHLSRRVLSSSSDLYPHLASWSFVGANYSSRYFTLSATETYSSARDGSGGSGPLARMSLAEARAFDSYDPSHEFPFVDVANHYVTLGASASPAVLEGLSLAQIGGYLNQPSSLVARAVDGSANYLVAALCAATRGAAPRICATPTTVAAFHALQSGVSPSAPASASVAPPQPPQNAPAPVWARWSREMHAFLVAGEAGLRLGEGTCKLVHIAVVGQKHRRAFFGVPAGVTTWALSFEGHCRSAG